MEIVEFEVSKAALVYKRKKKHWHQVEREKILALRHLVRQRTELVTQKTWVPVTSVVLDCPYPFLGPSILICKVRGFIRWSLGTIRMLQSLWLCGRLTIRADKVHQIIQKGWKKDMLLWASRAWLLDFFLKRNSDLCRKTESLISRNLESGAPLWLTERANQIEGWNKVSWGRRLACFFLL